MFYRKRIKRLEDRIEQLENASHLYIRMNETTYYKPVSHLVWLILNYLKVDLKETPSQEFLEERQKYYDWKAF